MTDGEAVSVIGDAQGLPVLALVTTLPLPSPEQWDWYVSPRCHLSLERLARIAFLGAITFGEIAAFLHIWSLEPGNRIICYVLYLSTAQISALAEATTMGVSVLLEISSN